MRLNENTAPEQSEASPRHATGTTDQIDKQDITGQVQGRWCFAHSPAETSSPLAATVTKRFVAGHPGRHSHAQPAIKLFSSGILFRPD